MSLIVTGTIGIDTIETPNGTAERILGGSGTYFSAAASFFGPVRLVAAVGEDFPEAHRAVFKTFPAVDLTGLETRKGSKTFAWGGRYHKNMNSRDTTFTELGVLAEKPPAVQMGMLGQLPKRVLAVADTMDLWINVANDDLRALLKKVDGLVLNYDEAELFTGKANVVTAGKHLLELGPRFVVIKKGEHGAILVHRDGLAALPAYPTETVVDPTGAGDTFAGGMMGSIAANPSGGDPGSFEAIRRSLVHGTVVASFTIEAFSLDRLRTLTRAEIDARTAHYTAMVRV